MKKSSTSQINKRKNLIRSDNRLVYLLTLNYSIENEVFNFKFENAFNNYENLNNIYIIINEIIQILKIRM